MPSRLVFNDEPLEKQIISSRYSSDGVEYGYTFPLAAALSKNDQHRQLKYQKISNLISEFEEISYQQAVLRNKMQKVHSHGWAEPILQRIDQFSTNLLTQNLNTLEKYLSQSEPIVQYSGEKEN